MRVRLRHILYLMFAGVILGGVIFWFGWINIAASSGHWIITDWFLHTAMRQSVAYHAPDLEVPDLEDPARIRRGAGHYETGCAFCHGSPDRVRGEVARAMVPAPPDLAGRIDDWSDTELFWIVMHGVKFSGMPAWPALGRNEEVWSVVAFLKALPGMDEARYTSLAYGETAEIAPVAPGQQGGLAGLSPTLPLASNCIRCHGTDGVGDRNGAFPRLDIQNREVIFDALRAYVTGARPSGIMQTAVTGLTDEELAEVAAFYAEKPVQPFVPLPPESVEEGVLERGRLIALKGIPQDGIAACEGCHGETALGAFPDIQGQYRNYLEMQLELFAGIGEETNGERPTRGGGRFSNLMTAASHRLSEDDIKAVAAWYASRPPAADQGAADQDRRR